MDGAQVHELQSAGRELFNSGSKEDDNYIYMR